MKKVSAFIILMLCTSVAHATDVATSQAYVDTAAAGLQDNLPVKTSDKVVTYTTTGGTTGEREIKTDLGNESTNQADTGIPTVGTVKAAVDDKQKKRYLAPLSDVNIVTYTGTTDDPRNFIGRGIVATTPIYDDTVNTFDNGLVTAKTLNDAIIAGVTAEVTKIDTPQGALWQFNRTAPKVLPTTANLPTEINGIGQHCYRRILTNSTHLTETVNEGCSTTLFNNLFRGDFAIVFPYRTGITYDSDTCVGAACYHEIYGISACVGNGFANYTSGSYMPVSLTSTTENSILNTAYELGKTGAVPDGRYCFCKLSNPVVAAARWVYRGGFTSPEDCGVACSAWCVSDGISNIQQFRATVFSAAPVSAQ